MRIIALQMLWGTIGIPYVLPFSLLISIALQHTVFRVRHAVDNRRTGDALGTRSIAIDY